MSSEKSTAIILRLVEFSETSLVVTLLTRDFGKLTAMAKGARRKKSPFEGALDLLAICRIVFLHKSSGAIDLLTEAKLERRFRSATKDLDRLYGGYYVAELLNKMTDDADPHPELFELAERTIVSLDDPTTPVFGTLLRFEMRMLTLLGHRPMVNRCVRCGDEDSTTATPRRVYFGLLDGGLLCEQCRPGKTNVLSVARESIQFVDRMAQPEEGWQSIELQQANKSEIRQMMNRYITHLLGNPPRLQKYLKKIN